MRCAFQMADEQRVLCARCPASTAFHFVFGVYGSEIVFDQAALRSNLHDAGWVVRDDIVLCAECARAKRAEDDTKEVPV